MRLKELSAADMADAQRAVADEAIAGRRGRIPAPLRAWIHSPELGRRAQSLGAFLRYDTTLSPYLSELAILVTARFWTSHFEWFAHKRDGLAAGIEPEVIDAIAYHRQPPLTDPNARLVYTYASTLHETHAIPPDLHAQAIAAFGEQGTVELVGLLGYYTLVAMTLNAFDIGLPDGATHELT